MAVLEVMLQQTYQGQICINRWNYISNGTPAAATLSFLLIRALGAIYDEAAVPPAYPPTKMMRKIAILQNAGVAFDIISARDVYSVTDFYETPFVQPLVGTQAGEGMSPVMAAGFRTTRVRTDVRRATKRFVGVPETLVGIGGIWIASAQTGGLKDVADAMTAVLSEDDEGNTVTFTPAVCGKEKYWPSGTPDVGNPAYRYWPTESAQMLHTAAGIKWDFYTQVRSQVSRQYGRGR